MTPEYRARAQARFMAKVRAEPFTDCWVWCGCVLDVAAWYRRIIPDLPPNLRPRFSLAGRTLYAYHAALILFANTAKPPGSVVRHSCDNSLCVNPEHLEYGTQSDNVSDEYNRARRPRVFGGGVQG